ncbi:hypothetical protein CLV90_3669 [Maribacter spongiicola]|uniref:Uncharacterized protein n=1 Tax=Maribacter spongiicola TaxID=1206753 RepID=A0A4R7JMF2_9FLAO|nr:hypothetical protein [Maribacter spongiicola]TDT38696.1 hypothetical protein CLV90_3669 [Maribacter spongiicola]
MEIHFNIIGAILIILAFAHMIFPFYFNWTNELQKLSLVNRQMMKVHTIFIALTVLLMGLLCLTSSKDLIDTNLGKTISLGFAFFWTIRLLIQFFGYSSLLWKGKKFETIVHIIFSILWIYISGVFWLNYFQ